MTPSNPSPDTGAGTPLIRCVCGEIEQNRAHHETQLSGWHPFAGETSRPATDPAGLDVETVNRIIDQTIRLHVVMPDEGGDSVDAAIASALNAARAALLARLAVADGPGPEERPDLEALGREWVDAEKGVMQPAPSREEWERALAARAALRAALPEHREETGRS